MLVLGLLVAVTTSVGEQASGGTSVEDGRVAGVARANGLSVAAAHQALRDPAVHVDRGSRIWYAEQPGLPATDGRVPAAPYPHARTFDLHSHPGANRVIYLDFDGADVSGTIWNKDHRVPAGRQPSFDIDGRAGSFSAREHAVIQNVWQRVAEDYAPMAVDVTTEDPGRDALERTSLADRRYGVHGLVSTTDGPRESICATCGGAAYLDVFDRVDGKPSYRLYWGFYKPTWSAGYLALTMSHEAGHTLALRHDGSSSSGYYAGQGIWTPLLGAGPRPLTQFSNGDYGGNERQDDFAAMTDAGLPLRRDDHGNRTAAATGVRARARGVITTRSDRDVFRLRHGCSGRLTVAVRSTSPDANLDIRMRLLSVAGRVLAVSAPAARADPSDPSEVIGLNARVSSWRAPGTYYVDVDGVGQGDPRRAGYSDYGSRGAYRVLVSHGC